MLSELRNKLILTGSLLAVFTFTLIFSYGPGYGGNLLAFLGNDAKIYSKMSPSDTVTPMVTPKKVVTPNNVTTITSVSPTLSPDFNDYGDVIYSTENAKSSVSPIQPNVPTLSPAPSVTQIMSPTSPVIQSMSPQSTASPSSAAVTSPSQLPIGLSSSGTPIPISSQSDRININTASLEELDKIPEVGLVIGQRIIDYRTTIGLFQKIEDIMGVKGIKDATFQKMKDKITVGP